jgi:hypothetical protein
VIGAGQIGNRRVPHRPEDQRSHHVQRPLVDGARGVVGLHAGRLSETDQRPDVGGQRVVVGDRVADVHRQGPGAVGVEHGPQHSFGLGEGVVPGDLRVAAVGPTDQRSAQSIGVGVNVVERGPFWTQMPSRPYIVAVGADTLDAALADLNAQPAHRLTQRAGDLVLDHCRSRQPIRFLIIVMKTRRGCQWRRSSALHSSSAA